MVEFAIVTIKLPRNPDHDPKNKKHGKCPIKDEYCTDITGSHHSYLASGESLDEITRNAYTEFGHVTRIETLHCSKLSKMINQLGNVRRLKNELVEMGNRYKTSNRDFSRYEWILKRLKEVLGK